MGFITAELTRPTTRHLWRIAFDKQRDGTNGPIFILRLDKGNLTPLAVGMTVLKVNQQVVQGIKELVKIANMLGSVTCIIVEAKSSSSTVARQQTTPSLTWSSSKLNCCQHLNCH